MILALNIKKRVLDPQKMLAFLNYLLNFQGLEQIPSRSVGYILRILGQNPTEDDIVEMVMKVRLKIILLML